MKFRIGDRKEGFTFHELYTKGLSAPPNPGRKLELTRAHIGGSLMFHRQELQRTLLNHILKFCRIHLSHRLIRCEEGQESVKLYFGNGIEEEVDILIAADGIKSVARESFTNEGIFYTGTDAFRALIPMETFVKSYPNHGNMKDPVIVSHIDS